MICSNPCTPLTTPVRRPLDGSRPISPRVPGFEERSCTGRSVISTSVPFCRQSRTWMSSRSLDATPPVLGKTRFEGAILDVCGVRASDLADPERVLVDHVFAGSFTSRLVVADPGGVLSTVASSVAERFREPRWIRARVEGTLAGSAQFLDSVAAEPSGAATRRPACEAVGDRRDLTVASRWPLPCGDVLRWHLLLEVDRDPRSGRVVRTARRARRSLRGAARGSRDCDRDRSGAAGRSRRPGGTVDPTDRRTYHQSVWLVSRCRTSAGWFAQALALWWARPRARTSGWLRRGLPVSRRSPRSRLTCSRPTARSPARRLRSNERGFRRRSAT